MATLNGKSAETLSRPQAAKIAGRRTFVRRPTFSPKLFRRLASNRKSTPVYWTITRKKHFGEPVVLLVTETMVPVPVTGPPTAVQAAFARLVTHSS